MSADGRAAAAEEEADISIWDTLILTVKRWGGVRKGRTGTARSPSRSAEAPAREVAARIAMVEAAALCVEIDESLPLFAEAIK